MELIVVMQQDPDWFVAKCPENGVASQGKTVEKAAANLQEALELYYDDEELPVLPKTYVTTLEVVL